MCKHSSVYTSNKSAAFPVPTFVPKWDAQNVLQPYLYFSQIQQEMSTLFSVVNFQCHACYCRTVEQYVSSHMHSRSSQCHGMVTYFKQWVDREFLVAENESGTNIHKQFKNVHTVNNVDTRTVCH
jgi:hypothetical protein